MLLHRTCLRTLESFLRKIRKITCRELSVPSIFAVPSHYPPAFGNRIKHDPRMMDEPLVMHNGRRLHMPEARLFEKAGLFSGAFLECDALVMSTTVMSTAVMSTTVMSTTVMSTTVMSTTVMSAVMPAMATVVTSAEANTEPAAITAVIADAVAIRRLNVNRPIHRSVRVLRHGIRINGRCIGIATTITALVICLSRLVRTQNRQSCGNRCHDQKLFHDSTFQHTEGNDSRIMRTLESILRRQQPYAGAVPLTGRICRSAGNSSDARLKRQSSDSGWFR